MNKKSLLINANIDNLTALWQTASAPYQSFYSNSDFSYAILKDSDWPNRLWFHKEINQEIVTTAKGIILQSSKPLTVPFWNLSETASHQLLMDNGFKVKFEQRGMSLKLKDTFTNSTKLKLQLVHNSLEAAQWSQTFKKSFDYFINPDILLKTSKDINYYLALYENQPVGTAITFKTETCIGIHSIGIPPEMRRKGFAKEIMQLLINSACEAGEKLMTLQASDMGKGLYLKLGFEEGFAIWNYVL